MPASVRVGGGKVLRYTSDIKSSGSNPPDVLIEGNPSKNGAPVEEMLVSEPESSDSYYWNPPEIKEPFPFLYRPTVDFPQTVCGREVNFKLVVLTLFLLGVVVSTSVIGTAVRYQENSSEVSRFLEEGNTAYVGASGLGAYIVMLICWVFPPAGAAWARTIHAGTHSRLDIIPTKRLHLPSLPVAAWFINVLISIITIVTDCLLMNTTTSATIMKWAFTDDIGDAYWDGPKTDTGAYYSLAVLIPFVTLGSGYLIYHLWTGFIQFRVLKDTLCWGYGGAIPLTILKFAFSGAMEEVGWSGVLFPQLLHATKSFMLSSLIGGFIWGIWHVPLVIGGGYNNNISPYWAAFVLPWMTTPWAFFHVWLRVRSFSIWPGMNHHH
eukprot:jgi/Bigna1/86098/estExt_fgenesh1_pg.C_80078